MSPNFSLMLQNPAGIFGDIMTHTLRVLTRVFHCLLLLCFSRSTFKKYTRGMKLWSSKLFKRDLSRDGFFSEPITDREKVDQSYKNRTRIVTWQISFKQFIGSKFHTMGTWYVNGFQSSSVFRTSHRAELRPLNESSKSYTRLCRYKPPPVK